MPRPVHQSFHTHAVVRPLRAAESRKKKEEQRQTKSNLYWTESRPTGMTHFLPFDVECVYLFVLFVFFFLLILLNSIFPWARTHEHTGRLYRWLFFIIEMCPFCQNQNGTDSIPPSGSLFWMWSKTYLTNRNSFGKTQNIYFRSFIVQRVTHLTPGNFSTTKNNSPIGHTVMQTTI